MLYVQVADSSILMARNLSTDVSTDLPIQNEDRTADPGLITAEYFFSLGAGFLHRLLYTYSVQEATGIG